MESSANKWTSHIGPTLKLALPVMLARAGILVLALVDTAMCGWAGAHELAFYGLGSSQSNPLLLIGIGMLLGTGVLTAQAEGAGRSRETGAIWRVSIRHAIAISLIVLLVCQFAEPYLLWTGQSLEMSRGGGAVLWHIGWGLPGALLFSASIFFLEALQRPMPGMIIMALANVLNVLLNWLFIFGHWGFPELGASGAALATSLARWFMFAAVLVYIFWFLDLQRYGVTRKIGNPRSLGKKYRYVGYPIALGQGLESTSFSVLAIFAAWLGTTSIAAWTIVMNILATIFMFSLGFTSAGSVRVAHAFGRKDFASVVKAGWTAAALTLFVIGAIAIAVAIFRTEIALLYADTEPVIVLTSITLLVTAWAMAPDGIQAVLIGALRGVSDFWPAAALQIFSFWPVMVPLAWYLGVYRGGDAPGLMLAVLIGASVSTLLLSIRFWLVCRQ